MADDEPKVFCFDIDSTITAAPEQYVRIATALQAQGDKIVCVTGHGPKKTRQALLDSLGFPYDEIVIVDPKDDGRGKRKALEDLDAFMMFDDRVEFGPEIIKVCPVAFQYVEPPGDKSAKKDAKKAAKALKRCLLVGGPLDGQMFEHHGLTDLLEVEHWDQGVSHLFQYRLTPVPERHTHAWAGDTAVCLNPGTQGFKD